MIPKLQRNVTVLGKMVTTHNTGIILPVKYVVRQKIFW